jgi:RHH-type rel operon transcriptional repressor/antitoxin RelB
MARPTELTLRLRPELLASLDELAGATQRSRADLAEEAPAQYLDVQRWQIEGIRAAIEEANRGQPGLPHERVAEWLDRWGSDDELPPPESGRQPSVRIVWRREALDDLVALHATLPCISAAPRARGSWSSRAVATRSTFLDVSHSTHLPAKRNVDQGRK